MDAREALRVIGGGIRIAGLRLTGKVYTLSSSLSEQDARSFF
jgi:hypothetical protein